MPFHNTVISGKDTTTGKSSDVEVTGGALHTIMEGIEIGGVIVEAPGVNDVYDVFTGTINTALTDQALTFSNVTTGYAVQILNKTSSTTLHAKFSGTGNTNIPIVNDTDSMGKSFTEQNITSIHLSNTSGSTITYEVILTGV